VIPVDATFKITKPSTLQETAQELRRMVVAQQFDKEFVERAQLTFPETRAGANIWANVDSPQEFLKSANTAEAKALYFAGIDYKTQLNQMAHTLNQYCTAWASRGADAYAQLRSIDEEHKKLFGKFESDWRKQAQVLNDSLPAKSPMRQTLFRYAQRRTACEAQFDMLKTVVTLPAPQKCVFQIPPELSGNAKALCVWMRDASERMAEDAVTTIYTVHVNALCKLLASNASHVVS
jgi:hypothetical protein